MLLALGDPLSFVVLVAAFVAVVVVHGTLRDRLLGAGSRAASWDDAPALRGPLRHLDPFGGVAAAIAGVGWPRPVAAPPRARRWLLLVAPLVDVALGLAALAYAGSRGVALGSGATGLLQEGTRALPFDVRVAVLAGLVALGVGLVSLVPLPPVDGGRLLLASAPSTRGWQQARYRLDEQNIGLVALLVLLVLPLGGPRPIGLVVLDAAATPLVRAVTGG